MSSRIALRGAGLALRPLGRAWAYVVAGVVALVLLFIGYGRVSRPVPGEPIRNQPPTVMTFSSDGERVTDGIIAKPGSPWNCDAASTIASGGSLEWDLGRVVSITGAFIQADNDDHYGLAISTDRKNWRDLWEAAPATTSGLSNRFAEQLEGEARYVRIEPRGGDGSYAVSEVSLRSPGYDGPWPPAFEQKSSAEPEVRGQRPRERMSLLAAAIAAAAFGVARLFHRRKASEVLRQPLLWVTLGLSIFLVFTAQAYAAKHRFNVVDDAYISLQYAKNWAQGNGLVFNPGERVEGYTNFLWTLLMVPLWPLSGGDPLLMTRLATSTALALAVLALWLVAACGRRIFGKSSVPVVFALLVLVFDDSFIGYPVIFALENQLLIALMLSGLALFLYRPRRWELWLGLSFALAGMTRPDALLFGGTFVLVQAGKLAWSHLRKPPAEEAAGAAPLDDQPVGWRSLVRIGLVFGGVFSAFFAARWSYYGELLPNTFHLKVGSTWEALPRGIEYVKSFVQQRWYVPAIALSAVTLAPASWVRWLALHAALHGAYVVYVGGDFYAGHRFLLALVPSLALLSAVVFSAVLKFVSRRSKRAGTPNPWPRRVALAGAVLVCALVRYRTLGYGPFMVDAYGATPTVDNNVQYMRWLGEVARAGSSMIVGDIGATGLFADVRVIDFFGVVDPGVARKEVSGFGTGKAGHEKVLTREEQLARKPTYIKWGYLGDDQRPPGYYIFNDFPRHLRVEGLWVLDDLSSGRALPGAGFRFGQDERSSFSTTGTAFEHFPAYGRAPSQVYVNGNAGAFVNTFTPALGDAATGKLTSRSFVLEGDRMRLLVGGGRDPERLRVSLIVDGRRAFSETGTCWETLGRREWDIAPLRGKTAHVEIVDDAVGAWGHILVDEIEQWSGKPNTTGRI